MSEPTITAGTLIVQVREPDGTLIEVRAVSEDDWQFVPAT